MSSHISDALNILTPDARWVVHNDTIVEWNSSDITQPTEEEINTEMARLQAEYDANKYQRDRAESYPSWQEQMDLIYHSGVAGLKAELKKTKDKYPKG